MELSRGVGEVWYAGGSSHGVDGLRLFACGADLPRVYLQRATAKAYKAKRHGSEPTARSATAKAYEQYIATSRRSAATRDA